MKISAIGKRRFNQLIGMNLKPTRAAQLEQFAYFLNRPRIRYSNHDFIRTSIYIFFTCVFNSILLKSLKRSSYISVQLRCWLSELPKPKTPLVIVDREIQFLLRRFFISTRNLSGINQTDVAKISKLQNGAQTPTRHINFIACETIS